MNKRIILDMFGMGRSVMLFTKVGNIIFSPKLHNVSQLKEALLNAEKARII